MKEPGAGPGSAGARGWRWGFRGLKELGLLVRYKPPNGLATHKRVAFFLVLGATMGTLLDALHVFNGVAYYSNWGVIPVLKVATYVPVEFAIAGVVVGMLRPELDEELDRPGSRIGLGRVIAGMVSLIVVWGGSGVLMRLGLSNAAICGILTPLAGVIWFALDPTRQAAVAAILTAVIGVIVESALVATGTYAYTRPDLFGLVPVWLPSLYLTACIAIGNLGWYLKYSWVKPRRKQG